MLIEFPEMVNGKSQKSDAGLSVRITMLSMNCVLFVYSMLSTLTVGSGVVFAVDGLLSLLSVPELIALTLLFCDRNCAAELDVLGLELPFAGVSLVGLLVMLPALRGSSLTIFLLRLPVLPVVLVLHLLSRSSCSRAATLLLDELRE